MGQDCLDCQRPLRGAHDTATDFPGTVRHGGRGLCNSCYLRHNRHGTIDQYERPRRGPRSEHGPNCLTCKRAIRPGGTTLADHPGTVKGTGGRCAACHALHTQGTQPEDVQRTAATLADYLAWRRPYRAKAGAL